MSWLSLSDISVMANGRLHGLPCPIERVCIDSRQTVAGDLFIALQGPRFDGHEFARRSVEQGAAALMVSRQLDVEAPQILVEDTMRALKRLAQAWRRQLNALFIALTGSNGKTTSKEMLLGIFLRCRKVWATSGNQNNHIGAALTALGVRPSHQVVIVELGANHSGEIAELSSWIKPHIGIVLNAGAAHLEGFGSLENVARAKGELFASLPASGVGIINRDDPHYTLWKGQLESRKSVSFGFHPEAEVRALHSDGQCGLSIEGKPYPLNLSLLGKHNCCNASAAAAAAAAAGVARSEIIAGLASVHGIAGRLCRCRGPRDSRILDDSYNANPDSLLAALAVLRQSSGEHWVALGDMAELGEDSVDYHRRAGEAMRRYGVQRLFTAGPLAREAGRSFGSGASHFDALDSMADCLGKLMRPQVTLLVKGSRAAAMDQLVSALSRRRESLC